MGLVQASGPGRESFTAPEIAPVGFDITEEKLDTICSSCGFRPFHNRALRVLVGCAEGGAPLNNICRHANHAVRSLGACWAGSAREDGGGRNQQLGWAL